MAEKRRTEAGKFPGAEMSCEQNEAAAVQVGLRGLEVFEAAWLD